MEIKVVKDILGANEQLAQRNRQTFDSKSTFVVNIMSSPGAGKTSFILEMTKYLKGKSSIGVIEGDLSSSVDAEKISRENVPVIQINTGGGCHLDANMVSSVLESLPLQDIDLLFIENVGNLVCPAQFLLGEHLRILISSVPEGDDKPLKYPLMFNEVDAILLNKIDLLPHLSFDVVAFSRAVSNINADVKIFTISSMTGEGFPEWVAWLQARMGQS